MPRSRNRLAGVVRRWLDALQLIASIVGIVWCVGLLNHLAGYSLGQFGILPREVSGLVGIVFWVVLHGDMTHLLVNTTPLVFLGFFVALRGPRLFFKITLTVWLLAGIAVWLVGRPAIHLGASGLVFGYFGFILAVALYEKSVSDLVVASVVLFYYGGMFFGLLPVEQFVSFESHLAGLAAGILSARLYGRDWVQSG